MRIPTLSASLALALFTLTSCQSTFPAPSKPAAKSDLRRSITDFGALPDNKTLNTPAIQKAIDSLAAQGGGTLIIPAGTFLSGALFLKRTVNLHLDKNAVLKGSTDTQDYPLTRTRIEGHFHDWLPALLNVDKSDHLRISGDGTLDGSGQPFWTAFRTRYAADRTTKNLDVPRPRLLFIQNSEDVQITGLHFKDSAFWNLHLYKCTHVLIDNLDIRAGANSPSTDGIDVDSSQFVTITHTFISNNDDCIALKGSKGPFAMQDKDSPSVEHIRVSDCTFAMGGSLLTCGSEATTVRDVLVEHCTVAGPNTRNISILRLKLRTDTPQLYEDIHFHDITLDGAGRLLSVEPWTQYADLMGQPPPSRTVKNISLSNLHGTFGSFGTIHPNPGDTVDNITLENINVTLTNPAPPQLLNSTNLHIKNVQINGTDYTGPAKTP